MTRKRNCDNLTHKETIMKPNYINQETEIIQFSVRVPKELNDFLQALADKTGISKNSLILTKLWELKKQN